MKRLRKTTQPTFVMATICLNFSYSHLKEKSPELNRLHLYQYGFSGFKSGYAPDLKIKKDNRGQAIIVINHTVEQLFSIAYGAGNAINEEQTIINVINPYKLQESTCYKLFVPQKQTANFYSIMQQSLNMEFPDYKITIEPVGNEKFMIITDAA